MKLRLTLRRPDSSLVDIAVTAEPAVRFGELATAIVELDPADSYASDVYVPGELTLEASSLLNPGKGEVLDPDDTLEDLTLASGLEIAVVPTRSAPGTPVAYVDLLSGPATGQQYSIARGSTLIGRGDVNDIRIDDAMISQRHARLHVGLDRIELIDLNSANGVLVQGEPVQRLELQTGQTALLGGTLIRAGYSPTATVTTSAVEEIVFTRSPCVEPRYVGSELEGAEFPTPTDPQPFPWVALVMPLIAGIAMYAFTRSPLSIIFVAISPLMMIGTWVTALSTRKRKRKQDRELFERQLERLQKRLVEEGDQESFVRRGETVALSEVYRSVLESRPVVWKLRPEHWSFLHLRLGVGEVPSRNTVKPSGNPDRAQPEDVSRLEENVKAFESLPGLPVVESVEDAGALGVCGDPAAVATYVRGIIAQITGLRAPTDVVLGGIVGRGWAQEFTDLKWLPHASGSEHIFGGVPLADTASAGAHVIASLEEVIAQRSARDGDEAHQLGALAETEAAVTVGGSIGKSHSSGSESGPLPAIVVLISDDAPVHRARLIQLLEKAAGRGIYPIWVSSTRDQLPAACRTFVEFADDGSVSVGYVRLGVTIEDVSVEGLPRPDFEQFARKLASYTDAGALTADTSDVPHTVSLLGLIGKGLANESAAVVDRWRQNGSILGETTASQRGHTPKLRAIVGQSGSGAMQLDLRAQGPHALVGGTTGSGKSEFLQAWVLAMAAEYSPQRVTFLFVDYKGGAAFADCTHLPHAVGLVTDLSPHLVRRALVSLRAELHFRETLFTKKKAKDIIELEKRGDPETPPALVIVIDEFAALVNEVPEFVDGVVDVAQRGRSLGIHLIMATQRPAGVIKDNLRANTNLRIALRMADEVDSEDVIGEKIAARFDPAIPGRAAAKTGPGRLTVFQSAYAGGWTFAEHDGPEIDIEDFQVGPAKRWETPEGELQPEDRELGPNDQQRMVQTIIRASAEQQIPAPRRPWLDELAEVYDLTKLRQRSDERLLLGVQDVPERQVQDTVYFSPDEDGHLAVYGTSGSGKSATLRTLAIAAGITPRGGPVHVYALDFGAGGLRMLEQLPHVGAVIGSDASDRINRLFQMLKSEIVRRSEAYAEVNSGTITQYRTASDTSDEPRILLLIDGFPSFRTEFEGITGRAGSYDIFQQIMSDGRSVGIHIALSADRGQAIPTGLQSQIQKRVILRMADEDGYSMLGVPKDVLDAQSPPGRAMIDGLEAQIAIIGGSLRMDEQAEAIARLSAAVERQGRAPAPAIRALPELCTLEELPETVDGMPTLGVSEVTLNSIGFEPAGLFVVAGGPGSGRTNTMLALAHSLKRSGTVKKMALLAPANSRLTQSVPWDAVASDGTSAMALIDQLVSGDDPLSEVAVFIEGAADFSTSLAEMPLNDLANRAKRGECLIISDSDTSEWHTGFGLMGALKATRRGVVLAPDAHDGEMIFKTPFPRLQRREFPPGRAMYVASGKAIRVQLPLVE